MTSANDLHLYERRDDYIPRVAAVHDLCGYGKCSLGVAIPVLSAAGCDVCPVPTGLFSSHTAFPGWYMHDTTSIMKDYTDAWKGIGVEIDAVYSGFLGAPEQVDRIRDLYETYPNALRVVDPVMADHGKVYPTYTPELCDAMAELAAGADILYTDVWVSMGEPVEVWAERINDLAAYQINQNLMNIAGPRAVFMHCLPAYHDHKTTVGREMGERFGRDAMEVTDEVFEGPQSIVFDEAENRMHTIKAVMAATLGYNG